MAYVNPIQFSKALLQWKSEIAVAFHSTVIGNEYL